ncbi:MAG: hypothetical protein P8010_14990, partial [Desulfosarcinaceae bacterium]
MEKPFSDSIAAPPENDPVYPAWENVVLKGKPPETDVRPEILRSWEISKKMGLDPYSNKPPSRLTGEKFKKLFQENELLIKLARPVMEMIKIQVEGTGFVITLSEKDGYVLVVLGDSEILEMAKR